MVRYMKIKEFAEIVSGSTPKTNVPEYWEGEYPWITPAEINEETQYIYNTQRKLTDMGVQSASLKLLKKGTVLLTSRAPIGKVAIAGVDLYCNQGFKNLICNNEIVLPKYLYYWLSSKTEYLNSLGRGATFKEISKSIVEEIEVPIPSLEFQEKIVVILDKVQQIIDKRKRQIKACDELIKSQFIELFGDPVMNPKGWKQATLRDISLGKLSYGSGASAVDYDGKYRYIRITDITSTGGLNDDIKSPSEVDEKYLLNDGDILFARSGATVGKTFQYKQAYGKCLYAGYLIRLVPNRKLVIPEYVFNYTKTSYYTKFIESNMKVVAQPNINAQQYGDLVICIPPIEIQNEFATFVQQVDKLKFEMEQSLTELENNFNSLMQKAFKGELF